MAGAVGLEPTAVGVTTRCACQWRLTPVGWNTLCDLQRLILEALTDPSRGHQASAKPFSAYTQDVPYLVIKIISHLS